MLRVIKKRQDILRLGVYLSSEKPWKDTMDLDDALATPARIAILLFLMPRSKATFSMVQKALDVTAGNLSSHLKKLEEREYVIIEKKFVDSKPTTIIEMTMRGHSNIIKYINILNSALKD